MPQTETNQHPATPEKQANTAKRLAWICSGILAGLFLINIIIASTQMGGSPGQMMMYILFPAGLLGFALLGLLLTALLRRLLNRDIAPGVRITVIAALALLGLAYLYIMVSLATGNFGNF